MWKTIAVLACVSVFAHAQNTFPSRGSGVYQKRKLYTDQDQQKPYQSTQFQSNQIQTNQESLTSENQYRQVQPELSRARDAACKELNERYPVAGSCDKYTECVNGTAEEQTCPDGLRFAPDGKFTSYPCRYPNEVSCLERSALQPAEPTADCPHQFGYFKLGDSRNCSWFRNCVSGVGYDFSCPDGLAFSSESYRCEWPDEVADCDAEAFVGFRCPAIPESKELGPPVGFRFYRSEENCQKYFLCFNGKPRSMSCGRNSAFDELTTSCVSADEVDACPLELRERAAQSREEEQQRIAKEIEFNSRPKTHLKRRL